MELSQAHVVHSTKLNMIRKHAIIENAHSLKFKTQILKVHICIAKRDAIFNEAESRYQKVRYESACNTSACGFSFLL